jgi:predicted amidohydrolase
MGSAQERILDKGWRRQQAGIIFGWAHGRMHVYFPSIRKAIAQGFLADTMATDLTPPNALHGPAHHLPTVMSKFLNLGAPLNGGRIWWRANP